MRQKYPLAPVYVLVTCREARAARRHHSHKYPWPADCSVAQKLCCSEGQFVFRSDGETLDTTLVCSSSDTAKNALLLLPQLTARLLRIARQVIGLRNTRAVCLQTHSQIRVQALLWLQWCGKECIPCATAGALFDSQRSVHSYESSGIWRAIQWCGWETVWYFPEILFKKTKKNTSLIRSMFTTFRHMKICWPKPSI